MTANINSETGIRYGVIDANSVPWLLESIIDNGVNETWEAFKRERIEEAGELVAKWEECGLGNTENLAEQLFDDVDWDFYEAQEEEYTYTDEKGNQFLLGYLGGAPLIWCVKTSKIAQARECSPCVPNAGDLNSQEEGGFECYGVPEEYLETEEVSNG